MKCKLEPTLRYHESFRRRSPIERWMTRPDASPSVARVPKVAVIISIHTQPGKRAELRALRDEHLSHRVEASAAQEAYLVVEDSTDEDTLHLIEVYNDPQEMQRNATAPWFAAYMKKTAPLLAGPPTMRTGVPVWSKGLPD